MSNVTRFGPDPLLDLEIANKRYVDSSGGGGNTFGRKVKTVDQIVSNSVVVVDDDELFVPLLANKRYGFLVFIYCEVTSASDIREAFSAPAGAVGTWGETLLSNQLMIALSTENTQGTSTGPRSQYLSGQVLNGGTPGNLNLQWAQNVAEVFDTTVRAGSFMVVWEEV